MGHAVLMSRFSVRCLLDILRQHDACGRPTGTCDAKRAIDDVAHLHWRGHHLHVLVRDVLEQRDEVDFLLKVRTQRHTALLAHNCDHGLMIPLGVVQTGQQVHGPRAGCREADADFATELGVAAGHERRRFLVPRLDELDLVGGAVERAENAVDAVTRVAVNTTHAPSCKASDRASDTVSAIVCGDSRQSAGMRGTGATSTSRWFAPSANDARR